MSLSSRSNKFLLIGVSAVLMVAFQNCSPVNFADKNDPVFAVDSGDPMLPPGLDNPVSDVPVVDGVPDEEGPGKVPDKKDPIADDRDDSADLVECELISPNKKIILSNSFQIGSNNSATRVCMSENACLKLINSYAAKRDCNLSPGPSALADSEAQCTKIFPGSKGTCHNASVISDADVAAKLEQMAK